MHVTATLTNFTLPNDEYYHICTQLNERREHLFNNVIQWVVKHYFPERNNVSEPDSFYIVLTSGARVGKSLLLNLLTNYLNRLLRYRGQNVC